MEVIRLYSSITEVGDYQRSSVHRAQLEARDPPSWLCDLSKLISPSKPQFLHLQIRDDNNDYSMEL